MSSGSVGSISSEAALAAAAADQARSSSSQSPVQRPAAAAAGTLRLESIAPFAPDEPGGCSFSPSGELLIGGLGIDGRNAWTGEAGWAAPTRANTWQGRRLIPAPMSPTIPRRGSQLLLPACPLTPAAPSSCSRAGSSFVACSPANSSAGSGRPGSARRTLKDAWRVVARRPSSVPELGEEVPVPRPPVNVEDVVEGRTCRPISLPDFRKHLLTQRITTLEPSPSMRSYVAELPDLSLLGGTIVTPKRSDVEAGQSFVVHASPSSKKLKAEAGPGDQLDALDFVVAVDRYSREFRSLSAAQRSRAPDVALAVAMATAGSPRPAPSSADAACDAKLAAPASQPLRQRFDHLVATYLGRINDDEQCQPRLRWMSNTGLLSDSLLQETLKTAARTTHPDALMPIALAVTAHLDAYVLPDFLDEASQNLSSKTKLGRLAVGVACTAVAIAVSVLLIMDPSPFSTHYRAARAGQPVDASVMRWWRLLTLPLWAAGTGYVLAAYTGVCVWLSLRGHREPERAVGVDSADAEASRPAHLKRRPASPSADPEKVHLDRLASTTDDEEQHPSAKPEPGAWLMAPELKELLLRLAGRGKSEPRLELPTAMRSVEAMAVPPPTLAHTPGTSPVIGRKPLASTRNVSTSTATSSVLTRSFSVRGLPLSMGFVSARPAIEEEKLAAHASTVTLHVAESSGVASVRARKSLPKRMWQALQRWTGFAVETEQVLDERVRNIHQRAAFMALVQCMVLTLVCTIIVMVIP